MQPGKQSVSALLLVALLNPAGSALAQGTPATPEPAPLAEFVREIAIEGEFLGAPGGVAIDAESNLYVLDTVENQVRVFASDGTQAAAWGETGEGPGQFRFSSAGGFWGDIALGPDGNLYVLDSFNHRVQVFSADGTFLRAWGEEGSAEGEFDAPAGITVDAQGRVYVAEGGNQRLQIFDSDGRFVAAWRPAGTERALYWDLADVAVDNAGAIYVSDYGNHQVFLLDPELTVLDRWGGFGSAPGELMTPWGAAVDARGNLFVADYGSHQVEVFAPDGRPLGVISGAGSGPGQFRNPIYLTLGPDDLLYVADETNRRVLVFHLLPGVLQGTPILG
jgi:tripartite motif-containing protein 71